MIKHKLGVIMCMVLMLTWSFNVCAESEIGVSFNLADNAIINLAEDDTVLTITASDTSVTDFDVYVNGKFYNNLEGYFVDINLKKLDTLGTVCIEAYANGEDGVLDDGSISLTLKDYLRDYIYQNDMSDLVEGEWPAGSHGDSKGGYMKPVQIDEEHGASMALGSTPEMATDGTNFLFGAKLNAGLTDVTSAVFECDIYYTGALQEAYTATPQFNTGLSYTFGINSKTTVNGSPLAPNTWYHLKWSIDLDIDVYSFTIDGYTINPLNDINVSSYSYLTGYTRFTAVPQSGKSFEVLIDNIEFYDPTGTKPAPEISTVVDNEDNSVVTQDSNCVKVTLTDAFGEVTEDNIKLVNTNGEQVIEKVTVDTENPNELYVYPEGGFMSGDKYYLVLQKDTPLAEGALLKDICYTFNTESKDIDFNGGKIIKQDGTLTFRARLTNRTEDTQNVVLVMYINKNGVFDKLYLQETAIPAGTDNETFTFSATEALEEDSTGYGFVITNTTDLTPVSDKLIQSQAY